MYVSRHSDQTHERRISRCASRRCSVRVPDDIRLVSLARVVEGSRTNDDDLDVRRMRDPGFMRTTCGASTSRDALNGVDSGRGASGNFLVVNSRRIAQKLHGSVHFKSFIQKDLRATVDAACFLPASRFSREKHTCLGVRFRTPNLQGTPASSGTCSRARLPELQRSTNAKQSRAFGCCGNHESIGHPRPTFFNRPGTISCAVCRMI